MINHSEKTAGVSPSLISRFGEMNISELIHRFFIIVAILFLSLSLFAQQSIDDISITSNGTTFIENKGQVRDQFNQSRPDIIYYGASNGFNFHLTHNSLHYSICEYLNQSDTIVEEELYTFQESDKTPDSIRIYRVDLTWLGANPNPEIIAHDEIEGYENFYNTPDESPDAVGVKSYKSVSYKNLYPGIDLRYFENMQGNFEYDLLIHPGADPQQIQFKIEGGDLSVSDENELIITTPLGKIIEGALRVFQDGKEIKSSWIIDSNIVSYSIAPYDKSKELLIDPPVRIWGTYYGGISSEYCRTMVDHVGNVYLTGQTNSATSIATSGAHQVTLAGNYDALLIKFNCAGMRIWGTYMGGAYEDRTFFGDVDTSGNIYIAGWTKSSTGISTPGSHQPFFGGLSVSFFDGFLARFTSAGQLVWSTYYGSIGADYANSCKIDSIGYIYLGGFSGSPSGIATPGTHQPNVFGANDAFLAKFDSDGTRIWGTYLGGEDNDHMMNLVIRNQSIICVGNTGSEVGIATSGAHQEFYGGGIEDGFLSSFDYNGQLEWSTYYGGAEWDYAYGCSVDKFGNIYYSGNTHSTDNISTPGCHQPIYGGGTYDAVLVKFDSIGVRKWGTYFGGIGVEGASFGVNDTSGNKIFICGSATGTSGISTLDGHQPVYGGGSEDAFLAEFDSTGNLIWSSYYGGTGQDNGSCIALNDFGNIYLAGNTPSNTNISTPGSHQETIGGLGDGFLVKFNNPCSNTSATINVEACNHFISPSQNYTWTSSGTYNDWIPNITGCDSILTINLIIHDTDTSFSINECLSYTLPISGDLVTTSGIYLDTLSSVFGCDSLLTITVNINNSFSFISTTACDYLISPSTNFTYTSSGTYLDTIPNSLGCDSIITIDLIINSEYNTSINVDTCGGIFSPSGSSFYSASGIYNDTLISVYGCDSIITTNLTINPLNTSVTTTGVTINASEPGLNYQWLDCDNDFSEIFGQTNQTYTATVSGDYAVVVSNPPCSDTSICVNIDFTSLGMNEGTSLLVYPNPSGNIFTLEQTGIYFPLTFQVVDITGKVVLSKRTMSKNTEQIVFDEEAGIYILEVFGEFEAQRFILVKI